MEDNRPNLITILGPTACGKTNIATALAAMLGGEIISADSRQLYRGMDIGTGKDLDEYVIDGKRIPYHLIDVVDAGYRYNLYEYQRDFLLALASIQQHDALPILCGGTGLYIEAALKGYRMIEVPVNNALRAELEGLTLFELTTILQSYKTLHNTTDVDTVKRATRAIEIADYYSKNPSEKDMPYPIIRPLLVGIDISREKRRERISQRLKDRLDSGMIEEVKYLINNGLTPDDLIYYGLEYKYMTNYLIGHLTYNEMVAQLEIAIHQFAKRQMTWFRGMERRGFKIHWLDGMLPLSEKIEQICYWSETEPCFQIKN